MSDLLGTTVEGLVRALRERKIRVPSEIGAFIALEVCEALMAGPAAPKGGDVRIASDGSISVYAPPGSATSEQASRAVIGLLGSLLVAAGTGVPRVLVGLVDRGPSSGRWDLASLRDDLEASLVPLNRAAARRILGRLLREAERAGPAPAPVAALPQPRDVSLDAQLDDLLSGSASQPPPPGRRSPFEELDSIDAGLDLDSLDRELDATLDELSVVKPAPRGSAPPPREPAPSATKSPAQPSAARLGASQSSATQPSPAPLRPAPTDPPPRRAAPVEDDATMAEDSPPRPSREAKTKGAPREPMPPLKKRAASDDLESLGMDTPRKGSPLPWLLAFLAILAATAAGLALMRPDLVDAALGRPPPPPPDLGPTEADRERMLREHRAQFGTLTVRVLPERAQVLMYLGRGPATATELPLGVAHEFVVVADGRAPGRDVIPPDATWEPGDGGHRYELAMRAGDAEMAPDALDLGATRLPQDVGSFSGSLGNVRIITNPPGARVYLLVGFSPEVVVENVHTDEAVEMLVFHEGHPVHRAIVGASDWTEAADGSKTASLEITLEGYVPEGEAPPPPPRRR